ncbi:MAG TPA: gliding motility protein GldM [Chitinophagaceae bacterium]|nr:gliding motility protein GldM [Chitinophagaceae bacterium]
MALPREPRQKMINMMYLVLTALLALNVSSEILNAFKTVNNSLETTNTTVNSSTQNILASLKQKALDSATVVKGRIWYPIAQQVEKFSSETNGYIQGLKDQILREAGGDPNNKDDSYKEDNLDIATRIMVEGNSGKELYSKLAAYKKSIFDLDPKIKEAFEKSLQIDLTTPPTKNKGNNTWEAVYFRMVPTVAALTILSKFQNDVKTSENKVIAFCHEQVGKVEIIFDTYEAIVGQNSKYLMPGQQLEITAGLGAFSKKKLPTVSIGGSNVSLNDKGMAVYKVPVGAIGQHTINVKVDFIDQDGKQQVRNFPVEYTVGQANASIALDKMNVLYIGVDNPVSIAASGGGDDKVRATISNGSLTRVGNGKYIARVNQVNDNTVITVSVDGKVAGASQFRVRTIPGAQAYVGGNPSGANVNAGAFRAQGGVGAGIKDFPFELKYEVVAYTFTCDTDEGDIASVPVSGNAFSGAVRTAINTHVKAGKMVTIDNIRVKGPDGRTTSAPSLLYYIK